MDVVFTLETKPHFPSQRLKQQALSWASCFSVCFGLLMCLKDFLNCSQMCCALRKGQNSSSAHISNVTVIQEKRRWEEETDWEA